MWQRFTERARRVILLAQEEAGTMRVSHVDTEHLLLGLMRATDGVGAQALGKIGVDENALRAMIVAQIEPSDAPPPLEPKLTPKAKRILELAADEARRLRHNYIGTEHLLLSVLRQKDGVAARALAELGLDLGQMRTQVLDYVAQTPRSSEAFPDVAPSRRSFSTLRRTLFGSKKSVVTPEDEEERRKANDSMIVSLLDSLLEGENAAVKILVESGLDIEAARERVKQFLKDPK